MINSHTKPFGKFSLILYSLLALPMACIELPLYLNIPQFYTDLFSLDLSYLGIILFMVRALDALKDPLLGGWIDTKGKYIHFHFKLIFYCLPFLCLGFFLLCHPSWHQNLSIYIWLIISLLIIHAADSMISITYSVIGASISVNYHDRTRIIAFRETFRLIGVFTASALPAFLTKIQKPEKSFESLSWIFFGFILLGGIALYIFKALYFRDFDQKSQKNFKLTFKKIFISLQDKNFLWLLSIFFINGLAISIPTTLALFFIRDVLKGETYAGHFISLYFIAGIIGMAFWSWVSRKIGKRQCWRLTMILSGAIFLWASFLTAYEFKYYAFICFGSGLMLGGDLIIPSSLIIDLANKKTINNKALFESDFLKIGSYFGIWNIVNKISLAVAPVIAFPLASYLGYNSGNSSSASDLPLIYAFLPCLLRVMAFLFLTYSPLDRTEDDA